jgi:ribosomal protein S17
MRIEKKVLPQSFQKILDGDKKYELRLADWDCQAGDVLVLKEWNPKTEDYTGRILEKEITYVEKTKDVKFWSDKEVEKYGYQIISFK